MTDLLIGISMWLTAPAFLLLVGILNAWSYE